MTGTMTRKPLNGLQNRYWKRIGGGGYCDNCHRFMAGALTPHKNKTTKRVICPECYQSGKR